MAGWRWGALGLAVLGWSAQASAECTMSKPLELPITMRGHTPVVSGAINGMATEFEVDSGAFYSSLTPGTASQFALRTSTAPNLRVTGVGGDAREALLTTLKDFELGTVHLQNIQFLVTGNEIGTSGLIGQNIWSRFDDEYDLGHGAIRLFVSKGCQKVSLAYWAKGSAFSTLKIEDAVDARYHTVGNVVIDGATVPATFDTGASTTILSMAAAARAGVRPGSPGVVSGGDTWGMGTRRVHTWIGHFDSIKIGDNEEIKNIRIRFGDISQAGDITMLIGADFFLSHRVLVDNTDHRLFLTYNGGPVFNLSMNDAESGASKMAQAANAIAGPDPTDADGYGRRGAAYLSRRDLPRALADLRQAVKLAPGNALYHRELAGALMRDGKRDEALAQLDAGLAAQPGDLDSLLTRAAMRLPKDKPGARADADAYAAAAPRQAVGRVTLGSIYQGLHAPAEAIGAYSDWIDSHPGDVAMANVLNDRCWVRALADTELDRALADCNKAVRLSSRAAFIVDSRALVWFRRGDFAKARADYDTAVAARPSADSIYMRALTEAKLGDKADSDKDLAAAAALNPKTGEFFASWGIKP